MKLYSYRLSHGDSANRLAVATHDDRLIDAAAAATAAGVDAPASDIHALIDAGPVGWDALRQVVRQLDEGRLDVAPLDRSTLSFLPAVTRPSKLCCLALNNSANADRILSGPRHPALFIKPSTSLVGHGQPIRLKPHYGRVHPEPELALIIGRTATDISPEQAYDHIFGYTIHNDLTSPTMRGEDTFHYRAIHPAEGEEGIRYVESHVSYSGRYKGADTFAPLGPCVVTRDEIPDPHDLTVECSVGGVVYTRDNTLNLFHKIPEVLAFISSYITLLPGDVVSMGTALASGGQPGRAVQNADLNRIDGPVEIEISGIGRLSNPVQRLVEKGSDPFFREKGV